MNVVGIIPARYQSSRFEGKPLALLGGRPMIQHVYERASQSSLLSSVVVATDDDRIFDAIRGFGGEAVMTSSEHQSGTDRVAEAAAASDAEVVVNIQGDEPFISPETIDLLIEPFREDASVEMTTLKRRINEDWALEDTNVVKVTADQRGDALYFSRRRIPFARTPDRAAPVFEHIGLYGYRKTFLIEYASMAPTPLELSEGLEQLRVLENGRKIRVVDAPGHHGVSVDTPEDLERAERFLKDGLAG